MHSKSNSPLSFENSFLVTASVSISSNSNNSIIRRNETAACWNTNNRRNDTYYFPSCKTKVSLRTKTSKVCVTAITLFSKLQKLTQSIPLSWQSHQELKWTLCTSIASVKDWGIIVADQLMFSIKIRLTNAVVGVSVTPIRESVVNIPSAH